MDINEIIAKINRELVEIKSLIALKRIQQNPVEHWIPIKDVMNWLGYGSTQMAALIKSNCLVVTKIGRRKFVLKDSIEKLLNQNIINPSI